MCAAPESTIENKAAVQVLNAFAHNSKTVVGTFRRSFDVETHPVIFDLNLYIAPREEKKQSDFSRICMSCGVEQRLSNHHQQLVRGCLVDEQRVSFDAIFDGTPFALFHLRYQVADELTNIRLPERVMS